MDIDEQIALMQAEKYPSLGTVLQVAGMGLALLGILVVVML